MCVYPTRDGLVRIGHECDAERMEQLVNLNPVGDLVWVRTVCPEAWVGSLPCLPSPLVSRGVFWVEHPIAVLSRRRAGTAGVETAARH